MAFVNAATFNSGPAAVTSIGTTLPTYSAGDTLVLGVATQGGAPQVLGGLGAWTLAPNGRMDNANGNLEVLAVYYIKNATGGESAPTITLTSKRICGFIASYDGRDATAPVATDHGSTNSASTNCTEGTGITVTDATSDILFIGAAQNFVTALKPTAPGTWNTERVDISTSAVGAAQSSSISLYDSNQATGATGAVTSVINSSQNNNAYLMELIPAASGQPMALRQLMGKAPGVVYPGRGI